MKRLIIAGLACLFLACGQVSKHGVETSTDHGAVSGPAEINAENCVDIAWLLTHYDVTRLISGSSPAPGMGYPLACCAEGVLAEGDAHRCDQDWPVNDVPYCEMWTEYHDALAAAHPGGRAALG